MQANPADDRDAGEIASEPSLRDPFAGVRPADPPPPKPRKPKKRLPKWTHGPVYVASRAAISLPLIAGMRTSLDTAGAVGRTFAGSPPNRKRLDRTIDRLRFVFPEKGEDWYRKIAIDSYEHLFQLGVEVAFTPRLITDDAWPHHCELDDVADALRVLSDGRPALLITGHTGNWELLGYTLAVLGFPVHALYRPLDSAPMDRWLRGTRMRRGMELLDKFGATERAPAIFEAGEPMAFVADQNAGDRGLFVPFFGRLASTYKSVGLLAMQQQATLVCGTARRVGMAGRDEPPVTRGFSAPDAGDGFRYRIDIVDVFGPDDWAHAPDPLFYITARYRRAIEQMVRRAPEQYLWMHRIWKSRPRHERTGKPFPRALREKLASLDWLTEADVEALVERSNADAAWLAEHGTERLP